MHTQTKEPPDNRFANVAVQLDELLERGEISPEAFAVYAHMADTALSSIPDSSGHTHNTAPTRFVEVDGIRFAYRRFGNPSARPSSCFSLPNAAAKTTAPPMTLRSCLPAEAWPCRVGLKAGLSVQQ